MEYITSRTNQKILDIVKLTKNSSYRKAKQRFVVEGSLLSNEAASSDYRIETMLLTSKAMQRYYSQVASAMEKADHVYEITQDIAGKLTTQQSTQGIFCVLKYKEYQDNSIDFSLRRVLLLEDISEPTNLGAISRSALAFGFDTLILSEETTDWLSIKALRASMGALLHMNVVTLNIKEAITALKENDFFVMAAALSEDAIDIKRIETTNRLALAIGNEANGLSKETIALCNRTVVIKTDNRIQSLNAAVAAAILMYCLK